MGGSECKNPPHWVIKILAPPHWVPGWVGISKPTSWGPTERSSCARCVFRAQFYSRLFRLNMQSSHLPCLFQLLNVYIKVVFSNLSYYCLVQAADVPTLRCCLPNVRMPSLMYWGRWRNSMNQIYYNRVFVPLKA